MPSLCLDTKDPTELVRTVRLFAPSFGAINLEDIAMPKVFNDPARTPGDQSDPVWHDDRKEPERCCWRR